MRRIIIAVALSCCLLRMPAIAEADYTLNVDTSGITSYLSDAYNEQPDFNKVIDYVQMGDIRSAAKYIARCSIDYLNNTIVDHKQIMFTIIGICLLTSLQGVTANENFSKVYELTAVCAMSIVLMGIFNSVFALVTQVAENLAGFMNVSLPVYFGVSASVTSRLPFSVYGAFVAFVALFHWGVTAFVFPAISVMALCSIAEGIYPSFCAAGIKKFISSSVHWALGLYTTIFIAVLKITQIASYGTDKLVMSGIRYTISHSVPVVGGFLSEAAGVVVTSTLILHNTLGIGSVLIIAFIGFLPFIAVFALSGIIRLIAAVMSPLAASSAISLLRSFGECLCELAVVLLCACVTFVIGVGIEMSVVR